MRSAFSPGAPARAGLRETGTLRRFVWHSAVTAMAVATAAADGPPPEPPPRPELSWIDSSGAVQTFGGVSRPSAVDCDGSGRYLVADRSANRVTVFGVTGEVERSLVVGLPEDADFLPGGGFLVTSGREQAVIEYDASGVEVWRYGGLGRPMDADRLADGNTLIADGNPPRILEVDRQGKILWSHEEGLLLPWDVELAAGGDILVADYNRHEVRCIRRDGTTCWRFNHIGHPSALHILPDGSFLVAAHKSGWILHVAGDRRVVGHWQIGREIEDFAIEEERLGLFASLYAEPRRRMLLAQMARLGPDHARAARRDSGAALLEQLRRGTPPPPPKPQVRKLDGVETAGRNVVLILFDSLRHDHVPWHGYWRDTAPHIAALAMRGLVFEQFIMQAPWTKPSLASLLTSTHAAVHGVTSQKPDSQLPVSLVTMAELLADAGYFTVGVMQNPHMGDRGSSKGFEQGYQRYVYLGGRRGDDDGTPLMAPTAVEILEKRPPDKPFFLTMFFMNPHYPYESARNPFGDKADGPSNPGPINDYDGEILEADEQVGKLLAYLSAAGAIDRTIVIFTSDHGEEFGDHGVRFHGDTLYDCVLRTPLVIDGIDRAGRFDGLVRSIDLLPTLLDFLGIAPPQEAAEQMAGLSVRPFLEPGVARTGLVARAQSRFRDDVHLVAERSETHKIIADFKANRTRIFDLRIDSQEYNDLATGRDSARELKRLRDWEEDHDAAPPDEGPAEPIPEEVLERLRAAGYLND